MKNFLRVLLASSFVCAAGVTPDALAQGRVIITGGKKEDAKKVSIDPIFDFAKLWTHTPATLETTFKESGFKWMSDKKDKGELRRERWGFETRELWAFSQGQELEEVLFSFKDGKLSEVSLAIWNKGDSDSELTEPDFNKKVGAWVTELNTRLAVRPQDAGRDQASAARAKRYLWIGKQALAQIEFSGGKEKLTDPFTGREKYGPNFQGEFIRLRLMPKPTSLVGLNTTTGGTAQVQRADLAKKVKREATGDVLIPDVPMVDQGDKGYCAVATAARVLNYYGVPADQHEMAQVANTDGGGGTNPDEMEEALRKLQGKYHVRLYQQIDTDYSSKSYERFLNTYNRAAKRLNKRVLDTDNYIYFMGGLDAEVLREVRGKGPIYDKFMKAVRENIDKGVPLLWGLHLGKYPENGEKAKQFGGGHMRLIIGYNNTKNEIIFSDSWGAGHEKKRMASPDASAATIGLYTITPSL